MKKILGLSAAIVMGLTSTAALASKARILALGEEVEDHFFIEDSRSIFTNAAYVNNYADTLTLEWGGNGAAGSRLDQDSSPKAQGGFLRRSGNYVYGIHLGNESNVSSFLRVLASPDDATTASYLSTADNQTDVFIGSEMSNGIKWGANLLWTSDKNEASGNTNSKDSAIAMRLGALGDNWDGYANVSLNSESEKKNLTVPTKFEGKLGYHVGGSYTMSDIKMYASVKTFKWEQTGGNQLAGVKTDGSFTRYFVGAGKIHKINSTDSVFVRAFYDSLNVELEYASGKSELNRSMLPVVMGYEANATSWLTLRGSVSYNLLGKAESKNLGTVAGDAVKQSIIGVYNGSTTDGEQTISDSTSVNAGASLLFGNLTIDGFVGTTATSRTATTSSKEGVLALDNLMTRVGMTYKF